MSTDTHDRKFEQELATTSLWGLMAAYFAGSAAVAALQGAVSDLPAFAHRAVPLVLYAFPALWLVMRLPRGGYSSRRYLGKLPSWRDWRLVIESWVGSSCATLGFLLTLALALGTLRGLVQWGAARDFEPGAAFLAVQLLSGVVVAPLFEEVVFRGVLFRKWRYTMGSTRALFLSSAIFGVTHFVHMLPAFMMGVVMVLLYTRTRTLWVPIVVHAIHNGMVTASAWSSAGEPVDPEVFFNDLRTYWWVAPSLLVVGLAWLAFFVRRSWATLNAPLPPLDARSGAT